MIYILRVKTAQIGVGLDAHQLVMFHWSVYLCVFTDTWRASLWESPTASHPWWVLTVHQSGFGPVLDKFFRSPLFGSALAHLVETSANFDGLDLFQGHFCRKKVWFSQSLVHLGGASYIDQITAPSIEFWSRSKPPRADLDAWLLFLHEVGRRTVGSPSVLLPPIRYWYRTMFSCFEQKDKLWLDGWSRLNFFNGFWWSRILTWVSVGSLCVEGSVKEGGSAEDIIVTFHYHLNNFYIIIAIV